MAHVKRIKLYGERNTGTRYLTRLFENNLSCRVIRGVAPWWIARLQAVSPGKERLRDFYFERTFKQNLGWKHAQADTERLLQLGHQITDVHFVALIKNPYSWLLSLAKRPYHQKTAQSIGVSGINALVTTEWPGLGRENGPASYLNAVDLWNRKVGSYFELASRLPTTLLTYEELVADPSMAVDKVRRACGDAWIRCEFENLSDSTKEKEKSWAYYRDYYGNEGWRTELTTDDIALINERIDRGLMTRLGYRLMAH